MTDTSGNANATTSDGSAPQSETSTVKAWHQSLLFNLNVDQRRLFRWAMTLLLIVLAGEWVWLVTQRPQKIGVQRGEQFRAGFRVDINRSSWVDWIQLEGIGPALANRIVADRSVNGPFRSIDDLTRVPGIGPATLARIRPWLTMPSSETPEAGSDATANPAGPPG